jgi:hypothetical protein
MGAQEGCVLRRQKEGGREGNTKRRVSSYATPLEVEEHPHPRGEE